MLDAGPSRISRDDYSVVREFIDYHRLWHDIHAPAPRIRPLLERFGWIIRERHDMSHLSLYGLAVRDRGTRLLYVNARAGCAAERAVYAHTLAHDILMHELPVDEMRPWCQFHHRRVTVAEELEDAARAATAIMLVPKVFIESSLSIEEIAACCLTTEHVVRRRLSGIAIGDQDSNIRRIDRRSEQRGWQRELAERRTGTDSLG